MQRNGQAEQAGIEKKKTDHTEKGFAIFEIDLSPRRNERREDLWIDHEIEHGEVSPVGSEKRSHTDNISAPQGSAATNQCSNFSSAASGWAPSFVAIT